MRRKGRKEGRGEGRIDLFPILSAPAFPVVLHALFLALMLPATARAQSYEEVAMRYSQPRFYHEAVALPGGERPSLVVAFRISNAMLVFVRNRQGGAGRAFVAEPRVTVQVYRDEQPVAVQVWRQPHYAVAFDDTRREDVDLEGVLQFDLEPGDYTYRLTLHDEQTGQERVSEPRPVTAPDFRRLNVGAPLLARTLRSGDATLALDLVNLGGDVPYGQAAHAVFPISLPDSLRAVAVLRYVLRRLDDPEAEPSQGPVVAEGVVEGAAWTPVWAVTEALWDGGAVRWPVALPSEAAAGYLAPVDLRGETLADGGYVLEITLTAGVAATTTRSRFRTYWRAMPLSLYHPEVAIRTLRFIEDAPLVKQMRKGSREEQEARIRAYWAARDPTPETPFNELMAEYYRRVDHAAEAFRTGQSPAPDGLRTDRAAIYILYGPPDTVERAFPDSGGVRETWTYAEGRQFVFQAATSLDVFRLQAR